MRLKKSIAFLMIIMMVFTLLPINMQAAKKVTLNKKKLTLNVGSKYNLKLKNLKKKTKVVWRFWYSYRLYNKGWYILEWYVY